MKPQYRTAKKEHGVSIVIAMIALVVISLAAAALIRTVNTATIISGNLAFKQSATNSGENAIIIANKWIAENSPTADNPAKGTVDNPASGYYATTTSLATLKKYPATMSHYSIMTVDATWTDDTSAKAVVANCEGIMAGNTDCSGNTIKYIIERLCKNTGAADETHCLLGGAPPKTGSFGVNAIGGGQSGGQGRNNTTGSPVYRITAKIEGPRNTVSYIQTLVY